MAETYIGRHKGSDIIGRDTPEEIKAKQTKRLKRMLAYHIKPTTPRIQRSPGKWRGPKRQRGEPWEEERPLFLQELLQVRNESQYGPFLLSRFDHGPAIRLQGGEVWERYPALGFKKLSNKFMSLQAANITGDDYFSTDITICYNVLIDNISRWVGTWTE